MSNFSRKLLAGVFLLAMLVIFALANAGAMPDFLRALYDFPTGDRIGHFVLYGVLAYLLTAAFPARRIRAAAWSVPLGVVLALTLAALEELTQLFIPARSADWLDLLAGWLGVWASTWIPCARSACPPT